MRGDNVPLKNYFYVQLLKIQHHQAPNASIYACFTRQHTKTKNPDYVSRRAKAGFGEMLKKAIQYVLFKELETTSSIPQPAL